MPSGNPLWPEFWSLKELDALKKRIAFKQVELSVSAKHQQQKKVRWLRRNGGKVWEEEHPPPMRFCNTVMGHRLSQDGTG
jgi:molybdenum cofactor biosynthesis enzyme MoaA